MDTSSRELSSGNRSSVGIEDDARAGGRYLVVPDGTSTTIDLEGLPPPAICEVKITLLSLRCGGGGVFGFIKDRTMISFSTVMFIWENVRL